MTFLNGARWLSGLFTGVVTWNPTASRTITLPDDSGTISLSATNVRYLFMLAGESNSGGMASNNLTTDQLQPQSQVQIWNNTTSTFQSLQIGTNNLIGHTGITDNSSHGIERGLAREVQEVLGLPEVYLVKAGQGGSTIAQWSVGNATGYLSTLTSRYNAALSVLNSRGFTVRTVVIWMQGVNDANGGTVPATWRTATQAHFTQLRSFMGASTPILFPKIMIDAAAKVAINTEIDTIDAADSRLWSVPTSGIVQNPADVYHYTASGYIAIAELISDTFRRVMGLTGSFNAGNSRNVTSNRPALSVTRSTALSIAHNVAATLPFDLVSVDTNTIYDPATGFVVIPPLKGGIYFIQASVAFGAGTTALAQIYINDVLTFQSNYISATTDIVVSTEVSRMTRLNDGDKVYVKAYQTNTTSAAKSTLTQLEYRSSFSMYRLSS